MPGRKNQKLQLLPKEGSFPGCNSALASANAEFPGDTDGEKQELLLHAF